MTPHQCRAARALLDWSQATLAEVAGVARATVAEFEAEKRQPIGNNLAAIKLALEHFGVEFLDGAAPGVRLHLDRVEAGIVDGERAVIFQSVYEPTVVALTVEDAIKEADRAEREWEVNRARLIRKAVDAAKKLKVPKEAEPRARPKPA